jgi:hypothetical protein
MNKLFLLNLDNAEKFFQLCTDRKAETAEEREAILEELVVNAEAQDLGVTELNGFQLAERINSIFITQRKAKGN